MAEATLWILEGFTFASPVLFLAAVVLPVGFRFRRRRWAIQAIALILLQVLAGAAGWQKLAGLTAMAASIWAVAVLLVWSREAGRFRAAWVKRWNDRSPVLLQPPFDGCWKALETGPSIARNHHLAARDQWFAIDWVRVDEPSRGSCILAPAAGVIAYVEDGHADKPARRRTQSDLQHPAGNYVALRLGAEQQVYLILAHLECGSICVKAGEKVEAGAMLGRCGNSGNTTIPHLHLHAQPAERFAAGQVWGIPIEISPRTQWTSPEEVVDAGFPLK